MVRDEDFSLHVTAGPSSWFELFVPSIMREDAHTLR